MKILLLGEYSNLHNTLAEALREMGHEVTLANNGDFWKDYKRDIDLVRYHDDGYGPGARIRNLFYQLHFGLKLLTALPRMRGFDIVQIINPKFMELTGTNNLRIYNYLRRHNRKMVMGAFGDDYYYVNVNLTMHPMRYSDYNRGDTTYYNKEAEVRLHEWRDSDLRTANLAIANDCDMIIAGAYEYWLPYHVADGISFDGFQNNGLARKLHYIPFPFKPAAKVTPAPSDKMRIFIGINKTRSVFKGTDIMLQAAMDLKEKYPDKVELKIAESVPFQQYQSMMDNSDVMLDQLYAYGPGMNALLALSKGIITLTGGEPEHYDLMGETSCRPVVNVEPNYESVFSALENLILHPEQLAALKEESRNYVIRNYEYHTVAAQYVSLYEKLLSE